MASRITLYGNTVRAARRLRTELGGLLTLPFVEVLRSDDQGSVSLTNPDEPTLRQCLQSENILSITAYWV